MAGTGPTTTPAHRLGAPLDSKREHLCVFVKGSASLIVHRRRGFDLRADWIFLFPALAPGAILTGKSAV